MTAALENTLAAVRDAADEAAEMFAKLITDLADDKDRDATEVVDICASAGKSLEDLQAAVSRIVSRRHLAEQYAALSAAAKEQCAAAAAINAAEADYKRLQQQLQQEFAIKIRAAHDRHSASIDALANCEKARDELVQTADKKHLDRRGTLTLLIDQAILRSKPLRDELARVRRIADEAIAPLPEAFLIDTPWGPEQENRRRQRGMHSSRVEAKSRAEQRRVELEKEIEKADQRVADYRQELADVERRLLQP